MYAAQSTVHRPGTTVRTPPLFADAEGAITMSYPDQIYFGDTGEISAHYRPSSAPPDLAAAPGPRTYYLATSGQTGSAHAAVTDGAYGLYRVEGLAKGAGTSTHFHKTMSEAFFITSGELRIYDGARWIEATRGDFLYVPAGGLHGFYNPADEPVSFVMLFAPGGPREQYFEQVAEIVKGSPEERDRFFVEHDSYFLDPSAGPLPPEHTGGREA